MLEDFPKEISIKTGEKIILRPMVKEDEKKLHAFFVRLDEKDRLFLKHDVTDPKVIRSWAEKLNYEHVIPILADIDEAMVVESANKALEEFKLDTGKQDAISMGTPKIDLGNGRPDIIGDKDQSTQSMRERFVDRLKSRQ